MEVAHTQVERLIAAPIAACSVARSSQGFNRMDGPELGSDSARMTSYLTQLSRNPERDTFALIYAFYAPRLKAYMRRLGADGPTAEDLAQEAMATVWRKADLFDSKIASASTWIFTIARNLRMDAIRRERRPEIDLHDPALVPTLPGSPEQDLVDARSVVALRAALAALPSDQARIIELSFFSDRPHREIAQELGVPLGTVKSRLRLAMVKIRKALGDPS
jgi:RNA polymerase sigma-70 factor (ECF subfamily)